MFGSVPVRVIAVAVLNGTATLWAFAVGAWTTVSVAAFVVTVSSVLVKTAR